MEHLPVIISIVVPIGTCVAFIFAIKASVAVVRNELGTQGAIIVEMRSDLRALNKVITDLAVQNVRMNVMEERQLAQGRRLDEAVARFHRWLDKVSPPQG